MSPRPALSRRRFLGLAGAAGAAGVTGGSPLAAAERAFAAAMRQVSAGRTRAPEVDGDWRDVLAAFDLGGRATMNTANLAPAALPSRVALDAYAASIDSDPSFQNRAQFAATRDATRERVAGYLGVSPGEIVLTRNTTEGNNFIVQGVELGPGDEVLLTEHNHPSNRQAWKVRAERDGFTVREVPVASPPSGPEELFEDLREATTDATRLIGFSHVTNLGGCRYPAAEICAWARERGILTLVDGAQTCGCLAVDLAEMAPDFYTASAHKWPCAPREVGFLYVRTGMHSRVWPSVVTVGYDGDETTGRFESLGQRDDAAIAAVGHAMEFLQAIGPESVEARVAALTSLLKEELSALPGVVLYTPVAPDFSGGVVTFHLEGIDARQAHEWLYRARRIVSAPSGVERGGVRFSPHIYTSMADCERAVRAIAQLVRGEVTLG